MKFWWATTTLNFDLICQPIFEFNSSNMGEGPSLKDEASKADFMTIFRVQGERDILAGASINSSYGMQASRHIKRLFGKILTKQAFIAQNGRKAKLHHLQQAWRSYRRGSGRQSGMILMLVKKIDLPAELDCMMPNVCSYMYYKLQ